MKNFKLLAGIAIVACASLTKCKNPEQSSTTKIDPVYTDIVLKVGNHEVTRYEFEKSYNTFQSIYKQQHRTTPDSSAVRSWINEFIDKQYLLADAYAKGYDKDKFVLERTQSMTRFMISQPKGLLDQELVSKELGSDDFTTQDKQKAQSQRQEKEKNILIQHNEEVLKTSEKKINGINLYKLADALKKLHDVHHFEKEGFKPLLNNELISYQFNGENKNITVGGFMDYYNMLPAKYPIENAESIRYYLEGMIVDDYDYQEAEKLGITKKPDFVLNRKNYANSLISNRYEQSELTYDTVVTTKEFQNLYAQQKEKYTVPAKMTASVYYFDDRKDAFNTAVAFSRMNNKMTVKPGKPTLEQKHIAITANTPIADTIKNALYSLNIGQASRPITLKKGYAVGIKESESGKRLKTMAELEPLFAKQIKSKRLQEKIKQTVLALKKKYKLQDHIDYKNYL